MVGRYDSPPTAVESDGSDFVIPVRVFDARVGQSSQVLDASGAGVHQPAVGKSPLVAVEKLVQLFPQTFRRHQA